MKTFSWIALFLLAAGPAWAQEEPHVFRGATLYPVAGPPIENGVLVVQNGKITAVGDTASVDVPEGAVEEDASGKVHPARPSRYALTHRGRPGGRPLEPLHPGVRSLDAVNVRSSSIDRARAGGVTTANIMPGSGHLMSGQTTTSNSAMVTSSTICSSARIC